MLHISIISCSFTASRNIELTSFGGKKELCDFSDTGILLAKLGPILVKYLQKKLAISFGLEISRESALNRDRKATENCPHIRCTIQYQFLHTTAIKGE